MEQLHAHTHPTDTNIFPRAHTHLSHTRALHPRSYYADVIAINDLEPAMRALNNAQLRNKTSECGRLPGGGWWLVVGTPVFCFT